MEKDTQGDDTNSCKSSEKMASVDIGGHNFKKKTFTKPTFCHYCSDMLWGLTNQGLQCTVCAYVTHERCQSSVVTPCHVVASTFVQIPQAHLFLRSHIIKGRFCNVCRIKVDDTTTLVCQACAYYIHANCRHEVVHNCKRSINYSPKIQDLMVKQAHHWTEGHLPLNSKCVVCAKSCSSQDCLTGLRCSWCLSTVHSFCVSQMSMKCDFGTLEHLVLPPYALSQVKLDVWSSKLRNMSMQAIDTSENLKNEKGPENEPAIKHSPKCLRVCGGLVRNSVGWRNIDIHPNLTTEDLLVEALKRFNISENKAKYFLTRSVTKETEEKLPPNDFLIQYTKGNSVPSIFLRRVSLENKTIDLNVYAGAINAMVPSITLNVSLITTAREIVKQAVKQLQIVNCDADRLDLDKYVLMQMLVNSERTTEVHIDPNDKLYDVLVDSKKFSLKDMNSLRFYIQPQEEQVSEMNLYVGNLPSGLSAQQYQLLLHDLIGGWDDEMSIVAAFSTQGSVILKFVTVASFLRIINRFNNAVVDGRTVILRLLPEIKDSLLQDNSYPLAIFVNSKSGGGQGLKLLTSFSRLLNIYQVANILDGGPLPILYMFRRVKKFRILVCGGDGTFGWVLSCLDEVRYNILECKQPPVALLPLGTGNDLSRTLNWGAGYTGESPLAIMSNVSHAYEVMLDRWNVMIDTSDFVEKPKLYDSAVEDLPTIVPMNNYMGIGVDAQLCLEFHLSREENPDRFNSRLYNKGVYFRAGLRNLAKKSMSNLHEKAVLTVDGKIVELPQVEGFIILNIPSWGAGCDLWGKDKDDGFQVQSSSDNLLEIVGVTGVVHMGRIRSGLSTGIRIAQGCQINLTLKSELPMQVDGEPWSQPPCSIMVRPTLRQAKMLMRQNLGLRKKPTATFTTSQD